MKEKTTNKIDDNVYLIVDGALNGHPTKIEEGVVGLVETQVPHVIHHFKNK